ncbi:FlbD protein [Uncinocarpus reesii 1704]|uniref:FlbD protein n=1 Tax=Uncinocarpus reesii (strain UAMH 1704) TaxID=336963 RepID=C4JVX2_UNCRE|nr:FlbD protein [Uncinocarpus reesii 1704]EEP81849.1 FlbD protein [Uncinocarpus reesii 1704]
MAPAQRRGPWVPEEDQELLQLVRTQGPNNWVRISQHMKYRSPKQCRERFHQNLKPSLNHDPITPEEGVMIERMVNEMGKRWAEIARRLGNRSDNAVKNWWNGSMNRKKRRLVPSRESDHASRAFDGRIESLYSQSAVGSQFGHRQHKEGQSSWLLASCSRRESSSSYVRDDWSRERSSPPSHHRHLPPLFTADSASHVDHTLTSPCYSEISSRTSAGPPSMISDHTSVASASPRTLTSPSIPPIPMELHPGYDERRRGSAPTVGHSPMKTHTHAYSSSTGAKSMEILAESEPGSRDWQTGSASAGSPHFRHHNSAQAQHRQLPAISLAHARSAVQDRDARMGVNNLLN